MEWTPSKNRTLFLSLKENERLLKVDNYLAFHKPWYFKWRLQLHFPLHFTDNIYHSTFCSKIFFVDIINSVSAVLIINTFELFTLPSTVIITSDNDTTSTLVPRLTLNIRINSTYNKGRELPGWSANTLKTKLFSGYIASSTL